MSKETSRRGFLINTVLAGAAESGNKKSSGAEAKYSVRESDLRNYKEIAESSGYPLKILLYIATEGMRNAYSHQINTKAGAIIFSKTENGEVAAKYEPIQKNRYQEVHA